MNDAQTLSVRELVAQGTAILRKNGFTAGGRSKGFVRREQCLFERGMTRCPFGGYSRSRRNRT